MVIAWITTFLFSSDCNLGSSGQRFNAEGESRLGLILQ
jgi:hypothetical protein